MIPLVDMLVCRYASSLGLAARQNTPAIEGAFYCPYSTSYTLQPSFHTSSMEPEPTGNGAPSGPNYTFFSGADRLLEASLGRSSSGYSLAPHAPALGSTEGPGSHCQVIHARMAWSAERIGRLSSKRGRMRCRRLTMYSYDPKRPQGSLWTTNGQGSTGAAANAHSRVGSRELKKNNFRPPVRVQLISLDS